MRKARRVSGIGGAALAVLLTVFATVAMHAQGKDGIKVHGHWTIDVRNADGTLSSHNDLENELMPSGGAALANVLGRISRPTEWRLELSNNASNGPCLASNNPPPAPSGIVVALQGGLTYDPQTGNWTSTATPTAGAPVFSNATPLFLQQFVSGEPVSFDLFVVDAENDDITATFIGTTPAGLSHSDFVPTGAGQGSIHIDFASLASPPGQYQFSISLADPGGHANTYDVIIALLPPPVPDAPIPFPCRAIETESYVQPTLLSASFRTLQFEIVETPLGSQNLQLTGNVTIASSDAIDRVRSVLVLSNSATLEFSARTLQTPIQVVPGQKVYVKVVFSFS
jgi:hypothetical protein